MSEKPMVAIIGGGRGAGRTLKAHIDILQELEAYRAIGTVEDFKTLKDAGEQGLLLSLDSKDELIEVLASKLLNEQFGTCYMCSNPMKNITLDGVNNGCDGCCNLSEEHTVDDFIKKIVGELERKKQNR